MQVSSSKAQAPLIDGRGRCWHSYKDVYEVTGAGIYPAKTYSIVYEKRHILPYSCSIMCVCVFVYFPPPLGGHEISAASKTYMSRNDASTYITQD